MIGEDALRPNGTGLMEATGEMAEEETGEPPEEAGACELISPTAQKAIDDRDKKIVELTDDLKRLQAEFENFKKRNEKDWSERVKFANQRIVSDLLMVLDSFDKAMEESERRGDASSLKDGIQMVRRQLMQILEREGLREIDTKGRFDPFLHEAVLSEEKEDAEDGMILEVYQKGYVLGKKAIRPAKVKVAKKAEPLESQPKKTTKGKQGPGQEEERYEVK